MDIKTLFDAAVDAGIDFNHDDVQDDCIDPWISACLSSADFMEDYLGDFLCELTTEENIKDISHHTTTALFQADQLHTFRNRRFTLTGLVASTLSDHCEAIGRLVVQTLKIEARKVVEKHLHDWYSECQGYLRDMEEGQEEDAGRMNAESAINWALWAKGMIPKTSGKNDEPF